MSGRLYVIDGLDGSGKSTQAQRVFDRLRQCDERVMLLSYPDYGDESSALVRMYLHGELSQDAAGVNAYAASSFYAVDRYASYMRHWRERYEAGWTMLATRYVSSNAIHQMSKLPQPEWDGFLRWLSDYEYNKLGLPKPNKVVFLDMPREAADRLLVRRYAGDESKKDIHEKDRAYLARCEETARYAARAEGWDVVSCAAGNEPLPVDTVTQKIMDALEIIG